MERLFIDLKQSILGWFQGVLPDWALTLASMLINIAAIAIFAPVTVMFLTWLERKLIARIQDRRGPNRVGPFGLLQPIADTIKFLVKEDIIPAEADKVLHFLAPVIIVAPALLLYAVIPFGDGMIAADLNIGLFFFLAISSSETVPIFMAGWGSRNKFSLLGAMRTVAQIVSYEVPLALSIVPVIMMAESLSTVDIVKAQSGYNWFIFTPWGFFAFLMFFTTGLAEVNRTPFDLPEGESEIVAGFHTEYSGMKFALFQMAEFLSAFAVAALVVILFFGGWEGPLLPSWLWFLMKTYAGYFIMLWVRGTLPRFRIDQLMGFAWKFLLPLSLLNILASGIWHFMVEAGQGALAAKLLAFAVSFLIMVPAFVLLFRVNFVRREVITEYPYPRPMGEYSRSSTL